MKKLFSLLLVMSALNGFAQEPNWNLSTLRIGPFKVHMKEAEAIELARKPLKVPSESNEYNGTTVVKYNNELLEVSLTQGYIDEQNQEGVFVSEISTKSAKFKTKSGIGIGSTREELWATYKDFSRIEILKPYDGNGGRIEMDRNFTIYDDEAGSMLTFVLRNNKVVEIKVAIAYEGC